MITLFVVKPASGLAMLIPCRVATRSTVPDATFVSWKVVAGFCTWVKALPRETCAMLFVALSPATVITGREIERELGATRAAAGPTSDEPVAFEDVVSNRLAGIFASAGPDLPAPGLYDRVLAEVERPLIQQALQATKGNQIRAAAVLGINRNTLRKKIQVLGIRTGRGD